MTTIDHSTDNDNQDGAASPVPHSSNAIGKHQALESQGAKPTPKRRRWPWVVAGIVVAGSGGAALFLQRDSTANDPIPEATIRAVTAEQRDLVEFDDLDGSFQYARTQTLFATTGATSSAVVTAIAEDGSRLLRGETAVELNALPTVLFYGDTPFYRNLTVGDVGDDVATLEANLASLGYHLNFDPDDAGLDDAGLDEDGNEIDDGFTVNGVFDNATARAVRRWQADLERSQTGEVLLGDAIVASGPVVVSNPRLTEGAVAQPGAPVLDFNPTETVQAFYNPAPGELSLEISSGPVESGVVFAVRNDLPLTALITTETFDRNLSEGNEGPDVEALEEMLVAMGYDARGDLVPDDEFDEITTEAVQDWQEDLQDTWDDLVIDGVVSLDDLIVINPDDFDGPVVVETATNREADVTASGSELFNWASNQALARVVRTSIPVAEQEKLTLGSSVDVELPDGTILVGTVSEIASSSTLDPTNPNGEPELGVGINLDEVPDSISTFSELDVTVKVIENLASNATVVPASAILATPDGGYAVEVIDADSGETSLVAIEPGLFADSFVEVTGIEPGTAVVIPS